MKTLLTMAAGLLAGAAAVAAIPAERLFLPPPAPMTADPGRWACPMLDFIGNAPGTCPVCGMAMARMTAGSLNNEQRRRIGVTTAPVTAGPAVVTVRATGSVAYDDRLTAMIIPRIDGRIVKRHPATAGCCVEIAAGAPIVDLFAPEVLAAQAELQSAVRRGDQGQIQALRLRFTRWNLDATAQAVIDGGEPVDTVTIRSPQGGMVFLGDQAMSDESLMVGRQVMAYDPLLRLVDPDRLIIVVHVPEARGLYLREGLPVRLSTDLQGDLEGLDARIFRVANEVNPDTRTIEVRISLHQSARIIKPGTLVTARIEAALGPDLRAADPQDRRTWGSFPLIPADAVLSTGVRDVAWVATPGPGRQTTYTLAPLALGPRLEGPDGHDHYIVRRGLAAGQTVVARGAYLIDSQAQLAGAASLLNP